MTQSAVRKHVMTLEARSGRSCSSCAVPE
ncbi:hypothetical protein [Burkholderia sp. GS2Y]|uniref:Uncharacterized protein n=1 Tax=Burkholderia theae TaxID=3143496 RepID=A0ABU9WP03_9BURK